MELSSEEKRLYTIFKDLKSDRISEGQIIHLIEPKRKLEHDDGCLNFQGDKLRNKIVYNRNYVINGKFDDNTLRFVLIHEEGHIRKGKSKILLYIILMLVIFAILAFYLFNNPVNIIITTMDEQISLSQILSSILILGLYLFIIIPIIWRFNWDTMFNDEFIADNYAAENVQKFFSENYPSAKLNQFLSLEPTVQEQKRINTILVLMKILGSYPDYHPSGCIRIEKVREKYDKPLS